MIISPIFISVSAAHINSILNKLFLPFHFSIWVYSLGFFGLCNSFLSRGPDFVILGVVFILKAHLLFWVWLRFGFTHIEILLLHFLQIYELELEICSVNERQTTRSSTSNKVGLKSTLPKIIKFKLNLEPKITNLIRFQNYKVDSA